MIFTSTSVKNFTNIFSNFDTDLGAVVGLSSVIDPEEENLHLYEKESFCRQ